MNLRQLEYFVAIVELGSLSKAAERVHIVQPALTQHVKNLEEEFGTPLLLRSRKGVLPTEAGQRLLTKAKVLLDQFEAIRDFVRGEDVEPHGEVRVGIPTTASSLLSARLLRESKLAYPNIKLSIVEPMSGFFFDWLAEAKVDIAVLYRRTWDRNLKFDRVLSEEICLVGRNNKKLAELAPDDARIAFRQACELPLVVPNRGHGLRDLLEDLASKSQCRLNVVMEIDAYTPMKALVEQGVGFCFLPGAATNDEQKLGRLTARNVTDPEIWRDVYLATPTDRPLSRAAELIHGLCKALLMQLVHERNWIARIETADDDRAFGEGFSAGGSNAIADPPRILPCFAE
ncbi:LysR family transcriptional regulator [Bradyrhizobium tropiciagri]|uniref:LysR family transcriptional regulator n=1 Tax=Bradyrhizobium tropiciagri TaxID=312253 RepID=UPI001BA93F44|nr:LysR family transcriptional regulator [Bradyrhizobium tropiciagri]MBR0898903.1 LysR family transcriptional regulator [Bradyrhizobium tropiciagri]